MFVWIGVTDEAGTSSTKSHGRVLLAPRYVGLRLLENGAMGAFWYFWTHGFYDHTKDELYEAQRVAAAEAIEADDQATRSAAALAWYMNIFGGDGSWAEGERPPAPGTWNSTSAENATQLAGYTGSWFAEREGDYIAEGVAPRDRECEHQPIVQFLATASTIGLYALLAFAYCIDPGPQPPPLPLPRFAPRRETPSTPRLRTRPRGR